MLCILQKFVFYCSPLFLRFFNDEVHSYDLFIFIAFHIANILQCIKFPMNISISYKYLYLKNFLLQTVL